MHAARPNAQAPRGARNGIASRQESHVTGGCLRVLAVPFSSGPGRNQNTESGLKAAGGGVTFGETGKEQRSRRRRGARGALPLPSRSRTNSEPLTARF